MSPSSTPRHVQYAVTWLATMSLERASASLLEKWNGLVVVVTRNGWNEYPPGQCRPSSGFILPCAEKALSQEAAEYCASGRMREWR